MKTAIGIILCIGTIFVSCCRCVAQTNRLDSVKIEFVGFNIETVFDISCDLFVGTFNEHGEKIKKEIYDAEDLVKFQALIKDFRQITRKQSFDVRGKIIYIYDKTTKTYCFDTFGCFYNDDKLFYNKRLLIYLTDKLNNNHPRYLDTLQYHE